MTETITPAGAMPVVASATPAQSAQAQSSPEPATGTDEQLGDTGLATLQKIRKEARDAARERDALKTELEALRTANQSDSEKALAAARKEGATEASVKADAKVRRSEVRRALTAAGCVDVGAIDFGMFGDLAVTEDGDVTGLDKAVATFRSDHPALFAAKRPTGSADAGSATSAGAPATTFTRAQLRDTTFYRANRAAIQAAQVAGRITG